MPSTLHEIVENKRAELAARPRQAAPQPPQAKGIFLQAISGRGTHIIAEIKPKSPSAGTLNAAVDLEKIYAGYSRYASAISVLTDEKYFGGSFDALRQINSFGNVPTLCKDFVLDNVQVDDAREAGAEAVLLIVKILDPGQLIELHEAIIALNMMPVVEVQNEEELQRALSIGARCILINNRNLDTFEIDLSTTERLAPSIPAGVRTISASGIETRADIERLQKFANCFLVGSSLMRSNDIDAQLRDLRGARVLVKTCGITSLHDAELAMSNNADLLGLIFVDSSPRNVEHEQAKAICETLGGSRIVGVFKDESVDKIKALRNQIGFRFVQLHGNESPEIVEQLKPCIKAITVSGPQDIAHAARYAKADFLLFDLPKDGSANGAVKEVVNWINAADIPVPFFIAGRLTPYAVRDVIDRVRHKNFIGVDVASGIESIPGVKSAVLLTSFMREVKGHAAAF